MPTHRLFIAIELEEPLRSALARLQEALRERLGPGLRWVRPDSIHLTLKFLGGVEAGRVDEVGAAMGAAMRETAPFNVGLSEVGGFPSVRRARVVWAGVNGDLEALQALQQAIETEVGPLGFPAEEREFHPHLTVARVRSAPIALSPADVASAAQGIDLSLARQRVEGVALIRSDLRPDGAHYEAVARASLDAVL